MTVLKSNPSSERKIIASAKSTLQIEAHAIQKLSSRLDHNFIKAVETLLKCEGHVIISGIGKTGQIGRKIAATFSSIGIPAFFMHAAEAVHGDLGMFRKKDTLLAISYSGSGCEILIVANTARELGANLISMTGNPKSELANLSDIHLDVKVEKEACPLNLAPTASTTTILALGDALAVACLESHKFSAKDFARFHPGGVLGFRLSTKVKHIMHSGKSLPIVNPESTLIQALEIISKKGMGMAIILDSQKPIGIFTDGDLRRLIKNKENIRHLNMKQIMKKNPICVDENLLIKQAAEKMDQDQINQILVTNNRGLLVGALHIHDLT